MTGTTACATCGQPNDYVGWVRPLRRLPSQDTTVLPEPPQKPAWPHSGHG
jgi:hypothetical protein